MTNITEAHVANVSVTDRFADSGPVPVRYRLGEAFVPKTRYLDAEFLKLELEKLFPVTWLMACRQEELHDVGQYVEYIIGDRSILIVREGKDSIRAYHNACRHRGTRLASGRGRIGDIRCPFHGWRWNLDGSIKLVLDGEEFLPRSDEELGLVDVRVDTWGGFVFINMDPNASPLLEYLDPIPTALEPFHLENMRYKWFKGMVMPCNWKTGIDAFIEAYHVAGTHPQLLRFDKSNLNPVSLKELERRIWSPTQVFERHSRFSSQQRRENGGGAGGDRYEQFQNEATDDRARIAARVQYVVKELRSLDTERNARAAEELRTAVIPEGMTASSYFATLRTKYALADGLDWPEFTPEQWAAAGTDWHVFPNLVMLPNQGVVLGYRSRPNGLDPDSCLFEAFSLEQVPVEDYDKKWSFEPQYFDNWEDADLGEVLIQDCMNLENVTVGMHSPSFDGHRLSVEQEMSVFNHHRVADTYLWD